MGDGRHRYHFVLEVGGNGCHIVGGGGGGEVYQIRFAFSGECHQRGFEWRRGRGEGFSASVKHSQTNSRSVFVCLRWRQSDDRQKK